MAPYRARTERQPADDTRSHRSSLAHRRNERDDGFYDDRLSPPGLRAQGYSSPPGRRTPPHAMSRTSSRGPAAGDRGDRSDRRRDRDRDPRGRSSGWDYNARDCGFSPNRERGAYRDRDREGYRSPSYASRSRSPSQSPNRSLRESRSRRSTLPPNKEVMMEGLATDMTEEDISSELKQHYQVEGLVDVRVIRDRQTKQSRQFGFLRFPSLPEAQSFVERNEPLLYLYGNPDHDRDRPAKVRIVYSRDRGSTNNDVTESDWSCKICTITNYATRVRCFRCQAYRADVPDRVVQKAINNGDNDAPPDNTPSQFLLFRGLEPSVTEELFVKGVAKLYKPSVFDQPSQQANKRGAKVASTTGDANLGAKEGTLRRVLLVRDRQTNESWRFGFAEFATVVDAMAALTRFNSFDKFTIASKPVLISYVHSGIFVPVPDGASIDTRFTFSPLGNPSMKIAYWDDEAYVAEFKVAEGGKERTKGKTIKGDVPNPGAESREANKSKKRKAESAVLDTSTIKKAAPSYLQRWSNQHAELHGLEPKAVDGQDHDKLVNSDTGVSSETLQVPPQQSYADPNRHCCYLCSRQFKTAADVNKHERLSDLHQKNLQSEKLVLKARAKVEKHRVQIQDQDQESTTAEYRDRAKERRTAFGVVNKKGQQVQASKSSKHHDKPSATQDKDDRYDNAEDSPGHAPIPSKGAALMGKMGYVAGAGLGASGTGTQAPIVPDMYVAGVGLGAAGGKVGDAVEEAERNTKGDYGGFLAKTKEGARERYERMG